MSNNYKPKVGSYEDDDDVNILKTEGSTKSSKRFASSVIPGQLIGNQKKMGKNNLAQSVGLGLLKGDLGSLKRGSTILDTLADDANLPDEFDDEVK